MGLAHPIGATSLQQAQLNSSGNPMGATQLNSSGPPTTSIGNTGQTTMLPHGFTAGTLHDPTTGAWNMDSGASSHLNNFITSLSTIFNSCMYPSISGGDDHSIPHHLYLVTAPSPVPHAFLISQHTWHHRLRHPGSDVLRHFVSNNIISYNKEKPHVLCHACGWKISLKKESSNEVINGANHPFRLAIFLGGLRARKTVLNAIIDEKFMKGAIVEFTTMVTLKGINFTLEL
nr:ribonuclease H-like domain-containing protein [Tanacetum cinerariifolium]